MPATADASNLVASEIDFLLHHPDSGLSPQQRALLEFLFLKTGHSAKATVTQLEISTRVLGRSEDLVHDDLDSRARVAVQRLRRALELFYRQPENCDRRHLFLPKGRYRLDLAPAVEPQPASPFTGADVIDAAPALAWMIDAPGSGPCAELAYRLAGTLSVALARAPLVLDGAIDVLQLNLLERDDAIERAQQRGVGLLARISLESTGGEWTCHLQLIDIGLRKSTGAPRRIDGVCADDPEAMARTIRCALVDPLLSPVPAHLAQLCPQSRLAVAMTFFRFMATQDRTHLPGSLEALQGLSESRYASPLTDALRIDAIRASYCFATSDLRDLPVALVEEASRIRERAVHQPYAALALGYIELATDRTLREFDRQPLPCTETCIGSLEQDFGLLDVLSGRQNLSDRSLRNADASAIFFDKAAGFIGSMAREDYSCAEAHAFCPTTPANFWMRAFQAAIAREIRRPSQAKSLFNRLCQENPGAIDYIGRAMTTMIPNEGVSSRLVHSLSRLS